MNMRMFGMVKVLGQANTLILFLRACSCKLLARYRLEECDKQILPSKIFNRLSQTAIPDAKWKGVCRSEHGW
jgi:hypothetical protein